MPCDRGWGDREKPAWVSYQGDTILHNKNICAINEPGRA
jgi:hypothetical protein